MAACLTRATISVVLNMDVDGIPKITVELLGLLLSESISSDNYGIVSGLFRNEYRYRGSPNSLTLKGLLDINGLLSTRLEIWDSTLGLAEGHCAFG